VGALVGINFARIANPAKDFPVWLGVFALVGMIAANVVLIIIHDLSKTAKQQPNNESKIA